ncbi:hypothetical protein ACO0RG_002811 [Hanseniaspora osmophila]
MNSNFNTSNDFTKNPQPFHGQLPLNGNSPFLDHSGMSTPVARQPSNFFSPQSQAPPQGQFPQLPVNQQPAFSGANMNHSGSNFSGNISTNHNNNRNSGLPIPSSLASFSPAVPSPVPSHTPVSVPPIDGFYNRWTQPAAGPAVQPMQQHYRSNPGTPLYMPQQLNPTANFQASQQQQQQGVSGTRTPSLFFPQEQNEADTNVSTSFKNLTITASHDEPFKNNKVAQTNDSNVGNFPYKQPLGSHSGPPQPPPASTSSFPQKPVFSQWKYIDTQENWQGPFSSANMDNWLRGGFFMESLQVMREVDGNQGHVIDQPILPFGIKNRSIFYLGQLTSQYNNHLIQSGQHYSIPPTSTMYSPFQHFDTVCSQIAAVVSSHPPPPGIMSPANDATIVNPLPTPPSSSQNQNSILHPQHTDSVVQSYNDTQKKEVNLNSRNDRGSLLSPSLMGTSMSESALQYASGTQTPVLGNKATRDFQSSFSPNDRTKTGSPRLNNKLAQKAALNTKKNGQQETTPEEIPRTKIIQSQHSPPEFSIQYILNTPSDKINTKENLAEREEDLNYQEIMHLYDPEQKSYYIESSLQIPFQKGLKEEYNEWPLDFYEMDDRLEDLAESIKKLKIEDEEIFKKYQTKKVDMMKFQAASKRKEQEEKQKKGQEELRRLKKEQEELKKKEMKDKQVEKIVQELIEMSEKDKSKKSANSNSASNNNGANNSTGSKKSKKSKKNAKKEKEATSSKTESPVSSTAPAVPPVSSSPSPSLKTQKVEPEKNKVPKQTGPLAQYKITATKGEQPKEEVAKVQPVFLAPWANAQKPNINKVSSLADVLAAEMLKKKEKDMQKEKQRASLLQKKILEAKKEEELLAKKQSGAPWASLEFQSSKKKELESLKNGIDKELQLQKQLEQSDFVKEQAKAWEELKKAQKAAAQEDSNWTTVEAKKVATEAKKQINIHTTANSYTPDTLRSVAKKSNTTASNKKTSTGNHISIPNLQQQTNVQSPKKSFLAWCKNEMKLNSGIKFADIIEVLLSLPDSPDGCEIIADTINSNSNTMNGKRFGLLFLTKRRDAENYSKDFLSWSEALKLFQNGDDVDWDFQVVSKKKKNGTKV